MTVVANGLVEDHERIAFFLDRKSGYRGIIVIHDTACGPAFGGCRMRPYPDEETALADALLASRASGLKAALAGLPFSGGSVVLIGDPAKDKAASLFEMVGRQVEGLKGRLLLARDEGVDAADLDQAALETSHLVGHSRGGSGDPVEATALGVVQGIKAAAQFRWGHDRLVGRRMSLLGLGPVGRCIAGHLRREGARLRVADRSAKRMEHTVTELGVSCVAIQELLALETDIFVPCADSGIINDDTLPHLQCDIVAGAADHQLLSPAQGRSLMERNILFAPDYVINAGGMINQAEETALGGYGWQRAMSRIQAIGDRLIGIFEQASREGQPPGEIAGRLAAARMEEAVAAAARPHLIAIAG